MIKLIILDLDHTSLTNDKHLPSALINTIHTLRKDGIMVTVATGRAFELTKPYTDMAKITMPVILNNGALIKDMNSGTIHLANTLTKATKAKILDYVKKENLHFTFYAEGALYTNDQERIAFYEAFEKDFSVDLNIVKTMDADQFMGTDVYKFLNIERDAKVFKKRYRTFKDTFDAHITQSQAEFLDILPVDTHKGNAVKWLKNHYNLTTENILVFGDNDNDVEMFKEAGISVAMPNGSDKARHNATMIALDNNNHDGVSKTLDYLRQTNRI
ncbi:MAG: Cof-type HAD-IIB family hydrolase [Bacillota bacterium]